MQIKKRNNQLDTTENQVLKLSTEVCPSFEEAEKIFMQQKKAKTASSVPLPGTVKILLPLKEHSKF